MARRHVILLGWTFTWFTAWMILTILAVQSRFTHAPGGDLMRQMPYVMMQAGVISTMLFEFVPIASQRLRVWALFCVAAWMVLTVYYHLYRTTEAVAWLQTAAYGIVLGTLASVTVRHMLAQRRAGRAIGKPGEES